MKNVLLSCLALFLLALVLVPAKANAHGLEKHEPSIKISSYASETTKDSTEQHIVKAAPVENTNQQKTCNGHCCSTTICCAAILTSADTKPNAVGSLVNPMSLSGLAPLGPPYPLFRPPRQIV